MNFKIFATVHSLMYNTNLIDSCEAHFTVQNASNIVRIARSDTGVVIDSGPHPSRTCKTSHCLSVFKLAVPTNPLIRLYFKYKTVFIPKVNNNFHILDIYNKM